MTETPNPMHTAPQDGTWVRLLVDFNVDGRSFQLEDSLEPQWTLGANNDAHTGAADGWYFMGWDWEQDCIVHTSEGRPLGWLPWELNQG